MTYERAWLLEQSRLRVGSRGERDAAWFSQVLLVTQWQLSRPTQNDRGQRIAIQEGRALQSFFHGEIIDAQHTYRIGLVTETVKAAALSPRFDGLS